MNRRLSPTALCPNCTHPNGDHDHPGGACGAHTSGHVLCDCPHFLARWQRRGDHPAAWLAWDAAHNAEVTT